MRNFRYATLGLFMLIIGCNIQDIDTKNLNFENLQTEIAVPFGTASYTMIELLGDAGDAEQELTEDATSSELMLIFRDTASYTFTTDIFDVPDISNTSALTLPNSPDDGTTRTIGTTFPFVQTYEPADAEVIDSIFHAASSSITAELVSTSTLAIDYVLELTNTTNVNSGAAVSFSGTLSGGSAMNHNQSLANHKTTFTEVSGVNTFDLNLTVDVTLNAGESLSNDQISVTINFLDQDFTIVFGKLGQDTVTLSGGRLPIAFFENFGNEGLEFGEPELTFDFRNSFGIPIGAGFGGIFGEESDGTRTFLSGEIVSTPPVIASSSVEAPVTGEVEQTIITINSSNSTLQDLLATSPTQMGFDVQGFTNPFDPTVLNFTTDTSSVTSFIELLMPMSVRLTDLKHELDFDIGGNGSLGDADSLTLRIITVNELPFAATIDIFILDEAGDTLYTVLEKQVLDVPTRNFAGTIQEPKINIADIPFSKIGIDAIRDGTIFKVVVTMNTTVSLTSEDIFVKLLADAKLDVTLSARAKINLKL